MDLEEQVREEELTTDELVEKHFVGPEDEGTTEVIWEDWWDEHPEEAPDNVRVVEDEGRGQVLEWEYDGFDISVSNISFGVWRFVIEVPADVGNWVMGHEGSEFAIRSNFHPAVGEEKEGFINDVELRDDGSKVIYGITTTNQQPMTCLESMCTDMQRHAEDVEAGAERLDAAFQAAAEND